jgi:hypothetical protein
MNLPDALGQAPTSREELNPLSICSLLCGEQGRRVGRAGRRPKLDGFWVHRMLQAGPPKSHRERLPQRGTAIPSQPVQLARLVASGRAP